MVGVPDGEVVSKYHDARAEGWPQAIMTIAIF